MAPTGTPPPVYTGKRRSANDTIVQTSATSVTQQQHLIKLLCVSHMLFHAAADVAQLLQGLVTLRSDNHRRVLLFAEACRQRRADAAGGTENNVYCDHRKQGGFAASLCTRCQAIVLVGFAEQLKAALMHAGGPPMPARTCIGW